MILMIPVEVLQINPSAVIFCATFNVDHEDWLTYSGGTDRPGDRPSFSTSTDLTQIANFPAQIASCDSYSPVFFIIISFFFLIPVFAPQWFSLFYNFDHVVVLVCIDFQSNSLHDAMFHRIAYAFPLIQATL